MNVKFIAPNPRQRAKLLLDNVLSAGTEQLAIACAFLTPGGVALLRPHAQRLRLDPSFMVVAWESTAAPRTSCPGRHEHPGQHQTRPLTGKTAPCRHGQRRQKGPDPHIENKRNFFDVSADILENVDPVLFWNVKTAAMKALAIT